MPGLGRGRLEPEERREEREGCRDEVSEIGVPIGITVSEMRDMAVDLLLDGVDSI